VHKGAAVRAAHVDHGLHAASAAWAERCAVVAAALGVELTSARVAVGGIADHGLEAAARDARYRALGELLAPGEVLLTAHHGDDQLETLLLRLMRGTGVRGLRGIIGFGPFAAGFLGRPLLGFTRTALRAQAEAWSLEWLDDPSNRETRHDRNFLRLRVLPQLLERWPSAVHGAQRLAEQMSEAEGLLDAVAAGDAAPLAEATRVPRGVLAALDTARQRNLLRYLVRGAALGTPSARKLEELRAALLAARPAAQPVVRWPGGEGRVFREQLYLMPRLPEASTVGYRAAVGRHGWSGPEGAVRFEPAGAAPGLPDAWLDAGITLAFRTGGERFVPLGRRHHRSLKHWLQEAGVLPWMRGRIPLLFHDGRLVAVADLWLADETRTADASAARWRIVWTSHPPIR
jgi:tRNA(Ile)-lysidine synthase